MRLPTPKEKAKELKLLHGAGRAAEIAWHHAYSNSFSPERRSTTRYWCDVYTELTGCDPRASFKQHGSTEDD